MMLIRSPLLLFNREAGQSFLRRHRGSWERTARERRPRRLAAGAVVRGLLHLREEARRGAQVRGLLRERALVLAGQAVADLGVGAWIRRRHGTAAGVVGEAPLPYRAGLADDIDFVNLDERRADLLASIHAQQLEGGE